MFLVEGEMDLGMETRKFKKEVEAKSKEEAKERAFALLGSSHRLKRNRIKILRVEEATKK